MEKTLLQHLLDNEWDLKSYLQALDFIQSAKESLADEELKEYADTYRDSLNEWTEEIDMMLEGFDSSNADMDAENEFVRAYVQLQENNYKSKKLDT